MPQTAAGTTPHTDADAGPIDRKPAVPAAGSSAMPTQGLSDMQALIPDASWTCNMPAGIPGPATGSLAFEFHFTVAEIHDIGQTQFGHRRQIDISGGEVKGDKLTATLMERGLDYELTLDNGVVEVEQLNVLRVGNSPVFMRNCGVSLSAGMPARVVVDFEAPSSSPVAWLNNGTYVGVRELDAQSKTLTMKVYDVVDKKVVEPMKVPAAGAGPHQSWDCAKGSGSKGAEVYTETVGLTGSVSVGMSKRGSRNIIPITGGTTSGMITGGILSGGADYQLSGGNGFVLDARYTLKTDDGELIIVRNCGPGGGLVPVFEAKKDGKYGWINEGKYLSSDPGIAANAVNITIYQRR
jgi:hypothetical protein